MGESKGIVAVSRGWNPSGWRVKCSGNAGERVGANAILTFKLTRKLSNITASALA